MKYIYLVARNMDSEPQYVGKFNKVLGMFNTGGNPQIFQEQETATKIAAALNTFIDDDKDKYIILKSQLVTPIEVVEHD